MEKKINIAELLKDCPKGMELDCTCADNVVFDKIIEYEQIKCVIGECRDPLILDKYGRLIHICCPKCVIFPKGKTTWEGFGSDRNSQFKRGDILYCDASDKEDDRDLFKYIFILDTIVNNGFIYSYCHLYDNEFYANKTNLVSTNDYPVRFATEEEKVKLFQAIKDNGYKWNEETKTLEKLIEPKFKVGDKVLWNYNTEIPYVISKVTLTSTRGYVYWINCDGCYSGWWSENELTPIPNKFDITTLKPFDKVLVRDNNEQKWTIDYFSFVDKEQVYPFVCVGHYVSQCIPYEENKHLLRTTNDCNEYYKTWKNE